MVTELIFLKEPYFYLRKDSLVVRSVMVGAIPNRNSYMLHGQPSQNDYKLWDIFVMCWALNPAGRPTTRQISVNSIWAEVGAPIEGL